MPAPAPQPTLDRLRELNRRGLGPTAIAQQVGLTHGAVCNIRAGRRRAKPRRLHPVTLDSMGIVSANGKLCRRCGDPMDLKTRAGICLECEVKHLVAQGLFQLSPAG